MSYISPSMDLFRNMFQHNVIFLYFSDDRHWVRQNFSRDRDLIVATSEARDTLVSTGEDLALLSLCDHVIMTRGTFSMWSALLAGGLYLRPCQFLQSASDQEVLDRSVRGGAAVRWPHNPLETRWQTSLWRDC